MILDDPDYVTSSFEDFVMEDTNYVTWFLQSSTGPIVDDCSMSGGRALGGITRARQASKAHLRLHIDTLQARMRDLKGAVTVRERYVQEEIARSLARERDLWYREREGDLYRFHRERKGPALG